MCGLWGFRPGGLGRAGQGHRVTRHNPLSSPTGVGRGRWLSFPNLSAAPLHHEARHSCGSESQVGSTWSAPACNSSQGVCALSNRPRLQHSRHCSPGSHRGQPKLAAMFLCLLPLPCLSLGAQQRSCGLQLARSSCPFPACITSGVCSSLSKVKEQADKPFPWSRGETASSSNPILSQGQGVIPENVGPEGDVCSHKMSENVL